MKTAICVMLFLFLIWPDPVELVWPHKPDAVHPSELLIYNIAFYEDLTNPSQAFLIEPDQCYVVTDERNEYVIGLFENERLFPLVGLRPDLRGHYGRVKLRVNGNIAEEIFPIYNNDTLNSAFGQLVRPQNIRMAKFLELRVDFN